MSESNTEINYKEAYEREHEKCADLADKIVVLESEKEDLQFKLDRIKKNKFWKATGPARSVIHFAQRQKERLSHCGGPKDILRKIRNKSHQKSLMESYGTGSFRFSFIIRILHLPRYFNRSSEDIEKVF